ncbi:unnamed protein product [Clavelina lepadiformis]|uniref:rRNA biogenesis protein RRP36 n=1 Tax=Clavelina lepadiformis TaxID=159417 RepID=A0ABP0FJV7_CLALP
MEEDSSESDISVQDEAISSDELEQESSSRLWPSTDSNMTLEQMIQLQEQVGLKKFKAIKASTGMNTQENNKNEPKSGFKRKNKNRPQEISSKIRANKLQKVVPTKQSNARDPRFDNLCGSEFQEEIFNKSFSFLNNIREREMQTLRKQLHKSCDESQKTKIKYLLNRMKQQDEARKSREEKRSLERSLKKKERLKVELGIKRPYFLKNSEKKELLKKIKNEQLEKSGSLRKADGRKDKKLKSKESKLMPHSRRLITD